MVWTLIREIVSVKSLVYMSIGYIFVFSSKNMCPDRHKASYMSNGPRKRSKPYQLFWSLKNMCPVRVHWVNRIFDYLRKHLREQLGNDLCVLNEMKGLNVSINFYHWIRNTCLRLTSWFSLNIIVLLLVRQQLINFHNA